MENAWHLTGTLFISLFFHNSPFMCECIHFTPYLSASIQMQGVTDSSLMVPSEELSEC